MSAAPAPEWSVRKYRPVARGHLDMAARERKDAQGIRDHAVERLTKQWPHLGEDDARRLVAWVAQEGER